MWKKQFISKNDQITRGDKEIKSLLVGEKTQPANEKIRIKKNYEYKANEEATKTTLFRNLGEFITMKIEY